MSTFSSIYLMIPKLNLRPILPRNSSRLPRSHLMALVVGVGMNFFAGGPVFCRVNLHFRDCQVRRERNHSVVLLVEQGLGIFLLYGDQEERNTVTRTGVKNYVSLLGETNDINSGLLQVGTIRRVTDWNGDSVIKTPVRDRVDFSMVPTNTVSRDQSGSMRDLMMNYRDSWDSTT